MGLENHNIQILAKEFLSFYAGNSDQLIIWVKTKFDLSVEEAKDIVHNAVE